MTETTLLPPSRRADTDLKAIYNNLADLFTLTHTPRIREIVPFDSIASTLYALRGTLPRREKLSVRYVYVFNSFIDHPSLMVSTGAFWFSTGNLVEN